MKSLLLAFALLGVGCTSSEFGGASSVVPHRDKADKADDEVDDDDVEEDAADTDQKDGKKKKRTNDTDLGDNEEGDIDTDEGCVSTTIPGGGEEFDGFKGKVYRLNAGTSALPTDFSSLPVVGQLKSLELDVPSRDFEEGFPGVEGLREWFAIVFEGDLAIDEDGQYEFKTISDDGSKVWVEGELVVNNDGTHAPTEKVGTTKSLAKGAHKLKVEWFQGPAKRIALQVFWRKVGAATFETVGSDDVSAVKDCDLQDLGEFD